MLFSVRVVVVFSALSLGASAGRAAEPLVLSQAPSHPPAWLDLLVDEPNPVIAYPSADDVVARGADFGIVRSAPGRWLAVHREDGLLAQLRPPAGTRWVGVDGAQRVVVMTEQGALMIARDVLTATRQENYQPLAQVAHPLAWDIAPDFAVVLSGLSAGDSAQKVTSIALTSGASVTSELPEGVAADRVLVRADGVVVVQGTDAGAAVTLVSRTLAEPWKRAEIAVNRPLRRSGQWIWAGSPWGALAGEGDAAGPTVAVLGADGHTWFGAADNSVLIEPVNYADMVVPSPAPRGVGVAPHITLLEPAAPTSGPPPPELADLGGFANVFGALGGGCAGADCVRLSSPAQAAASRVRYGFLADGACAGPEDDGHRARGESDAGAPIEETSATCSDDRPLTRGAHLVAMDEGQGSLSIVELPAGCTPARVESVAGLAVLFCAPTAGDDAQVSVFVRSRDGWIEEHAPATPSIGVPVLLADGTMAFVDHCVGARGGDFDVFGEGADTASVAPTAACSGLVRSAAALGQGEWTAAQVDDALALRALAGGDVLAVTGEMTNPQRFGLHLARPDGSTQTLVSKIVFEGDLLDVRVEPEGCVAVELGAYDPMAVFAGVGGEAGAATAWRLVAREGGLLEHGDCGRAIQEWEAATRLATLRVQCSVETASVMIRALDQASAGVLTTRCSAATSLEAGRYEVAVDAPGASPWTREVTLERAQDATLEATLERPPAFELRFWGGGQTSADAAGTAMAALEGMVSLSKTSFEAGAGVRLAPGADSDGVAGTLILRYVLRHQGLEAGLGVAAAIGTLRGRGADEAETANSAFTMRFMASTRLSYRVGAWSVHLFAEAAASSPWLVSGGAGVGFSF